MFSVEILQTHVVTSLFSSSSSSSSSSQVLEIPGIPQLTEAPLPRDRRLVFPAEKVLRLSQRKVRQRTSKGFGGIHAQGAERSYWQMKDAFFD